MKLTGCEGELLRRLAEMPFLDRMELAAVSGWSKGAVYRGVRRLEEGGLAAPVPHATDLIPLTGRFHLTAAGLRRLAQWDGMSVDELLRTRPVSARWRRILLERLDAVAAVYRLASAVSNIAYPMRFRWYRAAPMDAAIELSGGRTLAVVRQGLAADRTGFAKRVWRLWEGPIPGAVLVLVPDEARLRHARRLLTGAPAPAMLALERDAVLAAGGERVWHLPSIAAAIDLGSALDRIRPGGALPVEPQLSEASLPWDIPAVRPGRDLPDHMLPALLKPAEKRALDLLSDWPWISRKDLAGLMDVSEPRVSQLVTPLEGFGLAARLSAAGRSAWPSPTGGWRCWPAGTAPPWAWRGGAGASPPKTRKPPSPGATCRAREAGSFSGTWSTPRRCMASSRPWPGSPAPWAGSWSRSTRREGRRGTSGTAACPRGRAGCAPSTPTPSASCAGAGPRGPSSWSGSAAPCGPRRWRNGSPHTCATTPPAAPSTTTAHSPPSSSSSTTTWRRPTSCGWQGRRWTGPGSESPCGSPTGALSTPWGLWDGPGALPATGSPPTSSRCAEYPARDGSGAAALAPP